MKKLWGGAHSHDGPNLAEYFGRSLESDLEFWDCDVVGSIAHARMLGETGIISKKEAAQVIKGLEQILEEGREKLPKGVEDVHTAVELRLKRLIGDVAGKLHTARSRNDQVATGTRLYLIRGIEMSLGAIKRFQESLIERA